MAEVWQVAPGENRLRTSRQRSRSAKWSPEYEYDTRGLEEVTLGKGMNPIILPPAMGK